MLGSPAASVSSPAKVGWKGLLSLALVLATACSLQLDWRDVRVEDTALRAQMPCRPSTHARRVSLGGSLREMNLMACSAGGATWALAWVEGIEPSRLAELTAELRRLALSNIGVSEGVSQPLQVPGSTPNPASGRWQAAGRRPDGSELTQDVAVFSRGTRVFQATVLSDRPDAEAAAQFFAALRFAV
jgi:hypothetical protein